MTQFKVQLTPGIRAFLEAKEECEHLLKKLGAKDLGEFVQQVIEAHIGVEAVRWTQFTPYFNDGNACVFGIGSVELGFKKEALTSIGLSVDDYDSYTDEKDGLVYLSSHNFFKWNGSKTQIRAPELKHFVNILEDLERNLNSLSDLCLSSFDDHVEVTVFRDKLEVKEYNHD